MDDDPLVRRSDLAAVHDGLSGRIDVLSERVDILSDRMTYVESALTQRIAEEGAATRRHFNVMVERVEAAVKIVAEVNLHHDVVLDDHEARLKRIEKTG